MIRKPELNFEIEKEKLTNSMNNLQRLHDDDRKKLLKVIK